MQNGGGNEQKSRKNHYKQTFQLQVFLKIIFTGYIDSEVKWTHYELKLRIGKYLGEKIQSICTID